MSDPRRRTALMVFAIPAAMLALAYASVPLYRLFCQVTGFGGTTRVALAETVPAATDMPIRIRFDSNTAPGLPWHFRPAQRTAEVKIGERQLAFYEAANRSRRPVTGVATFNVTPDTAGEFFVKIDCFCFSKQTLAPGETVQMPVSYYVDPAILDDADGRRIEEITLSYTFFPEREETAMDGERTDRTKG